MFLDTDGIDVQLGLETTPMGQLALAGGV